jgi:hypothetical protein
VSLIIVNGSLAMGRASQKEGRDPLSARGPDPSGRGAAGMRPTEAQRRYLERGLTQAGGKLPLFDRDGREVARKTVESCLAHGWATPWVQNPIKPDWLVCRLTEAGYRALGSEPPPGAEAPRDRPPC